MTITREEAIKTLHELWRETNDSWYEEVFRMAIEALSERPTGEWIKDECKDGEQWYRCSNCGERYVLIETSGRSLDVGFPFCPHCTADMRGDEE